MSELESPDDHAYRLLGIWRKQRDAWKEAFLATRAYYSNNNGPNSTRYRAAIKQLKDMKLIK